jgi:hypothetical protein
MSDLNKRDALLGVLTKMVVETAASVPQDLVESNVCIKLVIVPRDCQHVLERKLKELQTELVAFNNERVNENKEMVN